MFFRAFQNKGCISSSVGFFNDFMELHCGVIGEIEGKQGFGSFLLIILAAWFGTAEQYLRFNASHFSSASLEYSPEFF